MEIVVPESIYDELMKKVPEGKLITTDILRKTIAKKHNVDICCPLTAGIFQLLFPDAPMYSIGFLISSFVIFAFNTSTFREQYMEQKAAQENNALRSTVSVLSSDYELILIVNFGRKRQWQT